MAVVKVVGSYESKLFRNNRSQAVRIPAAFELPGEKVLISKEGSRIMRAGNCNDRWSMPPARKIFATGRFARSPAAPQYISNARGAGKYRSSSQRS